jgi:hypothetical protein
MSIQEKIVSILNLNDYVVKAYINKTTCKVQYPTYTIYDQNIAQKEVTYKLNRNGNFTKIMYGETITLTCPSFALRTVIWADIRNTCEQINYNPNILVVYPNSENIEIGDDRLLIGLPLLDKSDVDLESKFISLVRHAIQNRFDDFYYQSALALNMDVPYSIVQDLIKKG